MFNPCCELLSKVGIFDIRNNKMVKENLEDMVVNCFQKLVSLIFGTTCFGRQWACCCCELLSKVGIFDIRNNIWLTETLCNSVVNCFQKLVSLIFGTTKNDFIIKGYGVVNCFQKLVSLIFGTTCSSSTSASDLLWIAFKSWYLWYSEQLFPVPDMSSGRCELLSKVGIFDIRNNAMSL